MAAQKGHCEAAKVLLEAGAAVNLANSTGVTALRFAAGKGHEAVVRLLLKAGADARLVDPVIHTNHHTQDTEQLCCCHRRIRGQRCIWR